MNGFRKSLSLAKLPARKFAFLSFAKDLFQKISWLKVHRAIQRAPQVAHVEHKLFVKLLSFFGIEAASNCLIHHVCVFTYKDFLLAHCFQPDFHFPNKLLYAKHHWYVNNKMENDACCKGNFENLLFAQNDPINCQSFFTFPFPSTSSSRMITKQYFMCARNETTKESKLDRGGGKMWRDCCAFLVVPVMKNERAFSMQQSLDTLTDGWACSMSHSRSIKERVEIVMQLNFTLIIAALQFRINFNIFFLSRVPLWHVRKSKLDNFFVLLNNYFLSHSSMMKRVWLFIAILSTNKWVLSTEWISWLVVCMWN